MHCRLRIPASISESCSRLYIACLTFKYRLDLPNYASYEELRRMLLLAITETAGFGVRQLISESGIAYPLYSLLKVARLEMDV